MSSENGPTGDWKEALKRMDNLSANIKKNIQLATLQNSLVVVKALKLHIENQDLGWAKLNPAYLKYKIRKGRSRLTLVSTSTLLNSITYELKNDGLESFVGVLRKGKRKDGKPPTLIAAVMEYGSAARGIPARPLFRPTFKELLPKFQARYKKALKAAIEGTISQGLSG